MNNSYCHYFREYPKTFHQHLPSSPLVAYDVLKRLMTYSDIVIELDLIILEDHNRISRDMWNCGIAIDHKGKHLLKLRN